MCPGLVVPNNPLARISMPEILWQYTNNDRLTAFDPGQPG